jgi:uncharacterized protein (TIGR00297 family)
LTGQVLAAPLLTALFASLSYLLGMTSRSGALGGFLVGTAIYYCLGPEGFAVLALFVVGGSLLTRFGYGRKLRAGTAEAAQGRRGAKNALANAGVALICALLAALTSLDAFTAAFVASLGAAFADTAESEVGQLYGRTPRLISTLRYVPPGTDGAVSLPGTLAGLGAAVLTAALGYALGLVGSPDSMLVVALAAFLGTVADSFVGATAPHAGNELTNVSCTFVAAVLALLLA